MNEDLSKLKTEVSEKWRDLLKIAEEVVKENPDVLFLEDIKDELKLNGFNIGAQNCSYCKVFMLPVEDIEDDCLQCPIFKKTKNKHCKFTPHEILAKMFYKRTTITDFIKQIKKEIEFLDSV